MLVSPVRCSAWLLCSMLGVANGYGYGFFTDFFILRDLMYIGHSREEGRNANEPPATVRQCDNKDTNCPVLITLVVCCAAVEPHRVLARALAAVAGHTQQTCTSSLPVCVSAAPSGGRGASTKIDDRTSLQQAGRQRPERHSNTIFCYFSHLVISRVAKAALDTPPSASRHPSTHNMCVCVSCLFI